MWHNPRLLNSAASFLLAVALLLFLLAGTQMLLRSPLFPLRQVTVLGKLAHTSRADISRATQGRITGNFFAVDLASVRAGIEQLPWVRRVEVRRVWPDRLEVSVEEHVALARWGDTGLVDTYGTRFDGQTADPLPLFAGPPGSEAEMTRRYRIFAGLLAPLGVPLERVVLTPRYAWQLRLKDGLQIVLGRDGVNDRVESRLARFVAAYPQTLGQMAVAHARVDLRYPNGFALRVDGGDGAPETQTKGKG